MDVKIFGPIMILSILIELNLSQYYENIDLYVNVPAAAPLPIHNMLAPLEPPLQVEMQSWLTVQEPVNSKKYVAYYQPFDNQLGTFVDYNNEDPFVHPTPAPSDLVVVPHPYALYLPSIPIPFPNIQNFKSKSEATSTTISSTTSSTTPSLTSFTKPSITPSSKPSISPSLTSSTKPTITPSDKDDDDENGDDDYDDTLFTKPSTTPSIKPTIHSSTRYVSTNNQSGNKKNVEEEPSTESFRSRVRKLKYFDIRSLQAKPTGTPKHRIVSISEQIAENINSQILQRKQCDRIPTCRYYNANKCVYDSILNSRNPLHQKCNGILRNP